MRAILRRIGWLLLSTTVACGAGPERPSGPSQDHGYIQASVALLEAVKQGQATTPMQQTLREANPQALAEELTHDGLRRAFWINVYNAHIILLLRETPELYEDRSTFFREERFTIAGEALSFDLVEHGILRRSKNKWSLGYLGKVVVGDFERLFRVDEVDGRIHFALNCGAESCPPVRVYHADRVGEELDENARYFLRRVTDVEGETVETTLLFFWFRQDFSDRGGAEGYLRHYGAIPERVTAPELEYKPYDWTLDIDNFVE